MRANSITFDVNMMMEETLGKGYGIPQNEIDLLVDTGKLAQKNVEKNRGTGWLGWMDLPYTSEETLQAIEQTAKRVRENFDTFVVLGIGGSALGPIAVQQALNHLHYNDLPKEKRKGPRFFVEDNIDPMRMTALLDVIDPATTCFNIITKSGATAETMSQYLIISEILKKSVGDQWSKHIIATTDPEKGNLIQLAKKEGFDLFFISPHVGGRFSELSPVGLLPAAICGIDIRSLLAGAAHMDTVCTSHDPYQNPALLQAILQYIATEKLNRNIQVMMPYSDQLKYMSDWFCQLWAESIGKNKTRDGKPVHYGQTPVKALGVTDQHSQLQLYTEGPFDKVITFLKVERFDHQVSIPYGATQFPDVAFLGGKSLNALMEAEAQGTAYALYKAKRMHQIFTLKEVSAYTIGELLYFFQMATAYMGELLNIDAFNQPGVEESKIATYAVLGSEKE
ncbi:MAG: glucose-6-phosphate isomerase, partial [Clostridiales bacterium]|nr:glucose-6-phosphate isomerase [Clostridiales bacterium]